MKLISLQINDRFRSLYKGFRIDFHPDEMDKNLDEFQPFCFAGLNGSGKSNVLEALAAIFFHLECWQIYERSNSFLPDTIRNEFNPAICSPNAFELHYFIKPRYQKEDSIARVKIEKEEKKKPTITYYELNEDLSEEWITALTSGENYLPELIVGYSSGENEILSLPFFKTRFIHYDEYLEALRAKELYKHPTSSLIYIDSSMSQAVLLANFLMQKEKVISQINQVLLTKQISRFRIIIRMSEFRQYKKVSTKTNTSKTSSNEVNLTFNLEESIDKLKQCASCWFLDKEMMFPQ